MRRTIEGVEYKASARVSHYKTNTQFYPIIEFNGPVISDEFYLNSPQPTRSKALTVAKNYIKNL